MTDTVFEFTRVDSFMDDINREGCFDTNDMDGITPNYRIVLASDCPVNIEDCLDAEGTLNEDVNIIDTYGTNDGYCTMLWSKGINGERTMTINSTTVIYDVGVEEQHIKAAFLVNMVNGTGYVIAYTMNNAAIPIDGTVILPCYGVIWSMIYGG